VNVALELVRFAGLRPTRVRVDRVTLRCPFHDDRSPSAAVLASGVLVCSAGCGARSPFDWLVELGRTPAEVMALLEELGLRDGDRPARRRAGVSRAPASPPSDRRGRPDLTPSAAGGAAVGGAREAVGYTAPRESLSRPATVELDPELLDRLEAARFERRRYDRRLAELRGFAPDVLDAAGAAIGLAAGYGFRGPRAALNELRLLLPVRDVDRRPVGLLAIAPNPERRHEPKVLALPGMPRLPLELVDVDDPIARVLLVCEGELDALTAASAGLPAVGVPGIAAAERHAYRIADLVERHELELASLIPDADEPGRRAFRALAAALADAGAPAGFADVLEDGEDVGSTLVELAAQVELARPELTPAERRREAGRRLVALTGRVPER
jgi:hypothetical protein